jgi:hypothetical protein
LIDLRSHGATIAAPDIDSQVGTSYGNEVDPKVAKFLHIPFMASGAAAKSSRAWRSL